MKRKISIKGLSKSFPLKKETLQVLSNIQLDVAAGEFLTIVGASGCGKSTLLRIIAGLDEDFTGEVRINNTPINGIGQDRGMVFQDLRLFPWLTVAENIAFGLENSSLKEKELIVEHYLNQVGLEGFENARPDQLSGGMAQRVAIARTLANKPEIILLDEPFGALDALTRIQMQQEILRIREQEKVTMVLVTHDIDEAVLLGDRVVIMGNRPGTIQEIINVKLSYPRDRNSNDFINLRRKIYYKFFANQNQLVPEDYII
jgi:sulfonate transport system ATP-binding protein